MNNKKVATLGLMTTLSVGIAIAAVWWASFTWFKMMAMTPPPMPPMRGGGQLMVKAQLVVEKQIVSPEKYIARVEPIESVELEARIEGIIKQVHFEEGADVTKGDLLFSIERDHYEAQVSLQHAMIERVRSTLNKTIKFMDRLKNADSRSVSQTDFESAESDVEIAKAELVQATANARIAELNLGYTEIRSPITGRIGKNNFTEGNLVRPTSGVLARIVQVNPVRVLFSATDRSYLKAMKMIDQGFTHRMNVHIMLSDGTLLGEGGTWSFINNEMDPETGTIAVRAQFKNTDGYLVPGSYVKVFISPANAPVAPIVPQNALMNDLDGYFAYIVNSENAVELRRIVIGEAIDTGFIVKSGLVAGDKVIIQGLQKAKPGMTVTVNLIPFK